MSYEIDVPQYRPGNRHQSWLQYLECKAGARASIQPSKVLCILEKAPRILPFRRSLSALVGRKMTVVRHQLFPQKPPGSRICFSRTGVQPSPGSSTIELPSAFAESGAYPPDRELPGSPQQCSLPLACRHRPEGHQIGARKRRTPGNNILSQPYRHRVSTDRPNREGSQLAASLEGEPGPTPAGKILPQSCPETRFRRERARDDKHW